MKSPAQNPLGVEKTGKLLVKFALPSIIGMMVGALYNIVDQIFIGQGVGVLGNAATNVSFPLTTISLALSLLLGVGGASNFNLALGAGDKEKAGHVAGNSIFLMVVTSVVFCVIAQLFLQPLMLLFGSSPAVLPYAKTYSGIIAWGIPFLVLSNGLSQLIRADGSPVYSMLCMILGAVINTILDPIFIFGLDMGIAGAAWATFISQVASCVAALLYFRKFKALNLKRGYFRPRLLYTKLIISLGIAACFNQISMTIVQIVMNQSLTYYGAQSPYGSEIPLASVGIITKVSVVMIAFIIGISQGSQPIIGYNYGAKKYGRVRITYLQVLRAVTIVSVIGFLCFQFFPRQIISAFGSGSELYFQFSERYFRIYMAMAFAIGVQPATATFFTAIGKAQKGVLISLTRQILFLLPLILIFPLFWGIEGIMFAGPLADGAAAFIALFFGFREVKVLKEKEHLQMNTAHE